MRIRSFLLPVIVMASGSFGVSPAFSAQSDLAPSAQRQAVNQQAAQLTKPSTTPTAAPSTAKPATTPFAPSGFEASATETPSTTSAAQKVAPTTVKPVTPLEIVRAASQVLQVKGTIAQNNVQKLMLKSAEGTTISAKVGDKLSANVDGTVYDVKLVGLDRNTFTIEYGGEKITRSIRQAALR